MFARLTFILTLVLVATTQQAEANMVQKQGMTMKIVRKMDLSAEAVVPTERIEELFRINHKLSSIIGKERYPEFEAEVRRYTNPKIEKWAYKKTYKYLAATMEYDVIQAVTYFASSNNGDLVMKLQGALFSNLPKEADKISGTIAHLPSADRQYILDFLQSADGIAFQHALTDAKRHLIDAGHKENTAILTKNVKHVFYTLIRKYGEKHQKNIIIQ